MTARGNRRPDDERDLLVRLTRLHPTWVVLGTVAVFLAAFLLPDLAAAAVFLLIAAGLAILLARTWPVLPRQQRVLRLAVLGLLVVVAATRVLF